MRSLGNSRLRIAILAMTLSLAGAVLAQQKSIQLPPDHPASQLKPGTGVNLASLNCAICHSLDYIIRQPPMDAAQWDAEVHKMIAVFGAPIHDADAKIISEYLAAHYGPQAAAPVAAASPAGAAARRGN
jgi:sulfite dehydrogenase (cytochrome) subunit B